MTTGEQLDFGSKLRRERERRKISLASVAESTKINKSLLASLEGGDASRWPTGIYRRAFLREYAAAVGLPSESIIAEFHRVFPEAGSATRPSSENDLRLTLAPEPRWSAQSLALQVAAAVLDGAAVVGFSAAIAMVLQADIWIVIGLLAVSYYSLATTVLGASPALSIMNPALLRGADMSRARNRRRLGSREVLHIVPIAPRPEAQGPQHKRATTPFVENARSAS